MDSSISKRQLRLGAVLLVAGFLPLTIPGALAETVTIGVTVERPDASTLPPAHFRQQTVSYGDLNLDTAEGLKTFNQRIASAVRNVCMRSDPRDLGSMRDSYDCREQAQARATADIAELDGAAGFGTK